MSRGIAFWLRAEPGYNTEPALNRLRYWFLALRTCTITHLIAFGILSIPSCVFSQDQSVSDFESSVRPLLNRYCSNCHSGNEAEADLDFSTISTASQIDDAFEIWDSVAEHLNNHTMPPEDQPQPTEVDRRLYSKWYQSFVANAKPQPAQFLPRRLSVNEYRNTLRSLLGFDLEVAIIEAEQTIAERSMVIKLLPPDPPGQSGFKNDTHQNPLTVATWDQYSVLVDLALEKLFSASRRNELEALAGKFEGQHLSSKQAAELIKSFLPRAWRRPVEKESMQAICKSLEGLKGIELTEALKLELKSILMSPSLIYRGLRMPLKEPGRQPVDAYEYAERLSYFLWADMPDRELMSKATSGALLKDEEVSLQVDRMLASTKSRSLTRVFASEWLTLNEIEKVSNNPPQMVALKSQPLDFMNYLFTNNRPLLELIDSDVEFINPFTSRMYGKDARQLKRYVKQKGIEVEIVPNQKIQLINSLERGGILTMPGILAMNKGPIIRGTWMLERILGEHLPEPPANVGQVPGNRSGENLSFRQRFELHRSKQACASCHNKIDPLGFALQGFSVNGTYVVKNYKPTKKEIKKGQVLKDIAGIDTSGQLPTGEKFDGIVGLKKILKTTQKRQVLRNIVKRTMSYALCRKLKVHDQPTVESIVEDMAKTNGTWRDLFVAVANSPQFRETIVVKKQK